MNRRDFMSSCFIALLGFPMAPGAYFSHLGDKSIEWPEVRRIKIVGIGCGGAVITGMLLPLNLEGVELVLIDTDHAALERSPVMRKYCLAPGSYKPGSGYAPDVGSNGVISESRKLTNIIKGAEYVIFVSYIGGNTGSGALPCLIEIAGHSIGIKCSAVVSTDFTKSAEQSNRPVIEAIRSSVDELVIINNDHIIKRYHDGCKRLNIVKEIDRIDDRIFAETVRLYWRKRAMLKI